MLAETLASLISTGAFAVMQAAGTDAWGGISSRLARLVGRGSTERASAELERLNESARVLAETPEPEREQARTVAVASMRDRVTEALEGLSGEERERAADELRAIAEEVQARTSVAGNTSITNNISGDKNIIHTGTGTQNVTVQ
ncbi:hypothetical protein [Streptomyces triticiradicis]|uniref:hypothetical protein n=1 Tax=Streptomyces triticiradicis TaxID=2651189 RepID=UPI001788C9EB|nr:hypothetical protein [Streptomyces triticiradicis]